MCTCVADINFDCNRVKLIGFNLIAQEASEGNLARSLAMTSCDSSLLSTSSIHSDQTGSGTESGTGSGVGSVSGLMENEYDLFGKGSTTTTSSAGTVIFRGDAKAAADGAEQMQRRRRSNPPPEPPPRNSNRDSTATVISLDAHGNRNPSGTAMGGSRNHLTSGSESASGSASPVHGGLTASESKEICDALNQLRMGNESAPPEETPSALNGGSGGGGESETEWSSNRERIRLKTQMSASRIPALCVVTPPPSDDESVRSASALEAHIQSAFLQHVCGDGASASSSLGSGCGAERTSTQQSVTPRVDLTECLAAPTAATDTPIVIKASVVKANASNKDGQMTLQLHSI